QRQPPTGGATSASYWRGNVSPLLAGQCQPPTGGATSASYWRGNVSLLLAGQCQPPTGGATSLPYWRGNVSLLLAGLTPVRRRYPSATEWQATGGDGSDSEASRACGRAQGFRGVIEGSERGGLAREHPGGEETSLRREGL
ncbi:MAG: hypothetical protein ACK56I_16350, partial [bacterium]